MRLKPRLTARHRGERADGGDACAHARREECARMMPIDAVHDDVIRSKEHRRDDARGVADDGVVR